jgi:hypothetical protein
MPEFRLTASAETIWKQSVQMGYDQDGNVVARLKANRHPEWDTFQAINAFRKEQYGTSGAANIADFCARIYHQQRKELAKKAAKNAKVDMLTKQRQRLQPAVAGRGAAKPSEPALRVPESEEDAENMTPEQSEEFLRQIQSGNIRVKAQR